MTPRISGSLAAIGVAALAALTPATAYAQDYSFPEDCAPIDVANASPECTASGIEVTVTAEDEVSWVREVAYPREAFDGFRSDIDGFAGTTEEYLESVREDVEVEPGVSFAYDLTDALVVVTIARAMGLGSEEANFLGVTSEDQVISFALAVGPVTDANSVTVTTPGSILESNGTVDGRSAVWNAGDLESLSVLSAQGEATPQVDTTRWIVAGALLVALAAVAALYMLVWRKRADGTDESIDLNPEFTDGSDGGTTT